MVEQNKPLRTSGVRKLTVFLVSYLLLGGVALSATPQDKGDTEFGPVVRAYLGYLRNEQEVVDDRVSRREISRAYYRRNSNRIRALRATAIRLAHESGNDYLPELEAVATDELGTLFEHPPKATTLHIGEVLANTFRYVGSVRSGEIFYVFARLDPYEQSERKRGAQQTSGAGGLAPDPTPTPAGVRPRRAGTQN